ncbi:Replication termination factor 2 [Babesia duncani]|uniref:Replication termination factor 2 n=1 Tax=Babesia duncani TaxID=323732 RepID=A0AAD9UNG8_9APIC|nr:Replication termination factor 2 [Babesia duncani]
MGGDGGSIPKRTDLVRTEGFRFVRNLGGMGYSPNTQSKGPCETYSVNQIRELRWKTCALSQEPLSSPIVACRIGLLYNKEAVIKYILSKKKINSMNHIRRLKDIKQVNFKMDEENVRLICPIVCTELSAANRGVLIWKCGCCISEKAFKQLICTNNKSNEKEKKNCPNCNMEFLYNSNVFNSRTNMTPEMLNDDVVLLGPDLSEEGNIRAILCNKT